MKILQTDIQCDICEMPFQPERMKECRKIETIREEAKAMGWAYFNRVGELPRDYCPSCRPVRSYRRKPNLTLAEMMP